MAHRYGENREQAALFPLMLDELVGPQSVVRVIDAWADSLDLVALGFGKARAQIKGAPPYNPADLLKLYLWGYLNAVRSSRALERECHRNVECMWLLARLAPDHKTIAEFRRTNSEALVSACAAFVQFARGQRLIAGSTVAIDGSKIRAVASRKAVLGKQALHQQVQGNAQQIEHYLRELDAQDGRDRAGEPRAQDVRRALAQLQQEQARAQARLEQLKGSKATALVQGEPDAQVMLMAGAKAPGYNLQTVLESESHLIVAHAVNNQAADRRELLPMAQAAQQALGQPLTVVADAGYANGEHLAALQAQGISSYVAVHRSVNSQGDGTLYQREAFVYDAAADCYRCPVGKTLMRKQVMKADKAVIYAAQVQDCGACEHKPRCTAAPRRHVMRHLYEEALQANAQRVLQQPQMMRLRRQTVEHPFADIKHRILGNARLLMRGLSGARSELSLAVLAYNLKRVFNMKGATWMRQAIEG